MTDDFNRANQPQKQLDADRSAGGGSPPKTALETSGAGDFPPGRTAIGMMGDDPPEYRLGEELQCRVLAIRPGGYEILILRDNIQGYLRSPEKREIGSVFVAQFFRWQDR